MDRTAKGKEQTQRVFQDKITHVVEEVKKTIEDSRPFFALNGVLRKMGNMALKVLEKSLNFLFKKGYEPW